MDRLVDRLAQLQCPLALERKADIDGAWTELLAWLLRSLDPTTFEQLKPQGTTSDTDPTHLLNVSQYFGLCDSTEHELMKGTSSSAEGKRVAYLGQLVELCTLDREFRSGALDLEKSRVRATQLLEHVSEDAPSLMSRQLSLFSTETQLGRVAKQRSAVELPSESSLRAKVEAARRELEGLAARVEGAGEHAPPRDEGELAAEIEEKKATLAKQFGALETSIGAFGSMYASSIEPWSEQEPSRLAGVGRASERACDLHAQLQRTLSQFERLKAAHGRVESGARLRALAGEAVPLEEYGTNCLSDQIDALEDACRDGASGR